MSYTRLPVLTLLLAGLIGVGVSLSQPTLPVQGTVGLDLIADGLTHPLALVEAPDGTGRLFILDQTGQIRIRTPGSGLLPGAFLDVSGRMVTLDPGYDERGLLGLAFHPDFASNRRFFVYYSAPLRDEAPDDWDHTSHISEFLASETDPNTADPASERILLQVDQPQSNHNAGTLAFGPDDGYLYISLGDGGAAGDNAPGHVDDWYADNAGGNAQDIEQNLLGSLLRIDVDDQDPGLEYAIPADNPFVGLAGVPGEQYAYGFRNPYRMSFDPGGSHMLLAGDAGQELWEEVSLVHSGGNYGWNVKEGTHCFSTADPENPPATCPDAVGAGHPLEGDPLIDPVIEIPNAKLTGGGFGLTIIGGHVYRGSALPDFDGRYLFGVFSRGETELEGGGGEEQEIHFPGALFVAEPQPSGLWPTGQLLISTSPDKRLEHFLLSFGQDLEGEVYALVTDELGPTGSTGKVFRLVPGEAEEVYEANLAGYNEPAPNPFGTPDEGFFPLTIHTPATGSVEAELDGNQLVVTGSFSDFSADYTASHIHLNPSGVNGGVVIPLDPALDPDRRGGTFDQTFTLSDELVQALREGRLYVNAHTTAHPPGEIRGQLLLAPNHAPAAVHEVELAEGFSFDFVNEGNPLADAARIEWETAHDPDGGRVIYQVEVALDPDFNDVVLGSLPVMGETVLTELGVKVGAVDDVLGRLGVAVGEEITIYARVNSSDGSLRTTGENLVFHVTRGVVGAPPDETPPVCGTITPLPDETGQVIGVQVDPSDPESGIQKITFRRLRNATATVNGAPDPFREGDELTFPAPFPTDPVLVRADKDVPGERAQMVIGVMNGAGLTARCDPVAQTLAGEAPDRFGLDQNYPNPFNPATTIRFQIAEPVPVRLAVYDVLGRQVALLIDEPMEPGTYEVPWAGTNDAGPPVAGGMYLYRLEAGSFTEVRAMQLVK